MFPLLGYIERFNPLTGIPYKARKSERNHRQTSTGRDSMRCKALQLNIYEDDTYDANGLRTSKTVSGTTTEYYYNGSVLIGMTAGTVYQRFSYDSSGKVVAVDYSDDSGEHYTTYYYLRNGQGDIVKLIDNSGNTVVEYKYDTWGKQLSCTGTLATTLGQNQPFRYRGYVYDTETGWYYLQSRYYNPTVGRFISADVLMSTGQGVAGYNMYAYCLNNPVNMVDDGGCLAGSVMYMETDGGAEIDYVSLLRRLVEMFSELDNVDCSAFKCTIREDDEGSLRGVSCFNSKKMIRAQSHSDSNCFIINVRMDDARMYDVFYIHCDVSSSYLEKMLCDAVYDSGIYQLADISFSVKKNASGANSLIIPKASIQSFIEGAYFFAYPSRDCSGGWSANQMVFCVK